MKLPIFTNCLVKIYSSLLRYSLLQCMLPFSLLFPFGYYQRWEDRIRDQLWVLSLSEDLLSMMKWGYFLSLLLTLELNCLIDLFLTSSFLSLTSTLLADILSLKCSSFTLRLTRDALISTLSVRCYYGCWMNLSMQTKNFSYTLKGFLLASRGRNILLLIIYTEMFYSLPTDSSTVLTSLMLSLHTITTYPTPNVTLSFTSPPLRISMPLPSLKLKERRVRQNILNCAQDLLLHFISMYFLSCLLTIEQQVWQWNRCENNTGYSLSGEKTVLVVSQLSGRLIIGLRSTLLNKPFLAVIISLTIDLLLLSSQLTTKCPLSLSLYTLQCCSIIIWFFPPCSCRPICSLYSSKSTKNQASQNYAILLASKRRCFFLQSGSLRNHLWMVIAAFWYFKMTFNSPSFFLRKIQPRQALWMEMAEEMRLSVPSENMKILLWEWEEGSSSRLWLQKDTPRAMVYRRGVLPSILTSCSLQSFLVCSIFRCCSAVLSFSSLLRWIFPKTAFILAYRWVAFLNCMTCNIFSRGFSQETREKRLVFITLISSEGHCWGGQWRECMWQQWLRECSMGSLVKLATKGTTNSTKQSTLPLQMQTAAEEDSQRQLQRSCMLSRLFLRTEQNVISFWSSRRRLVTAFLASLAAYFILWQTCQRVILLWGQRRCPFLLLTSIRASFLSFPVLPLHSLKQLSSSKYLSRSLANSRLTFSRKIHPLNTFCIFRIGFRSSYLRLNVLREIQKSCMYSSSVVYVLIRFLLRNISDISVS